MMDLREEGEEEEKQAMLIDDSVPADAESASPAIQRPEGGVLGAIKALGRSRKP